MMFIRKFLPILSFFLVDSLQQHQEQLQIDYSSPTPDDELKPYTRFGFQSDPQLELKFQRKGKAKILKGSNIDACWEDTLEEVSARDHVHDFALAKTGGPGGACSSSKKRTNSKYRVQFGSVGKGLEAYHVKGPQKPAKKKARNQITIFVRKPEGKVYTIYELLDTGFAMPLANITGTGSFTSSSIRVKSAVYVIAPSGVKMPMPSRIVATRRWSDRCEEEPRLFASLGNFMLATTKCNSEGQVPSRSSKGTLYEKGTAIGSDGSKIPAYRIHPQTANDNLMFFYKASSDMNLVLYWYDGKQMHSIPIGEVTAGKWTNLGFGVRSFKLTKPTIFVLADPKVHVSHLPKLSSTAEGGRLQATPSFSLSMHRYKVGGRTWRPEDRNIGPGRAGYLYGFRKNFFGVARRGGVEGVVWQDQKTRRISVTWFSKDLKESDTVKLLDTRYRLFAAASNEDDRIVIFMATDDRKRPGFKCKAELLGFNSLTGSLQKRVNQPVHHKGTRAKPTMNIKYMYGASAAMVWDVKNGMIGLHINKYGGGGHEAGKAMVIDPKTLKMIPTARKSPGGKVPYSTGSHSYGSTITTAKSKSGGFYCLDIIDIRGLRGMRIYNFKNNFKAARRLVTVKFKEAPARGGTKVWIETAHPGVVEVDDGLLVFFSTENDPLEPCGEEGCQPQNRQRDVGFIKIPKDLRNSSVLSKGPLVISKVFKVKSIWQKNEGLEFITANPDKDHSAGRVKTAYLKSGQILVWWERWSRDLGYQDTQYAVVNNDGSLVQNVADVAWPVRLGDFDEPVVKSGRMVMYTGDEHGSLIRYEVCAGVCKKDSALMPKTTTTTTTTRTYVGIKIIPQGSAEAKVVQKKPALCSGGITSGYCLSGDREDCSSYGNKFHQVTDVKDCAEAAESFQLRYTTKGNYGSSYYPYGCVWRGNRKGKKVMKFNKKYGKYSYRRGGAICRVGDSMGKATPQSSGSSDGKSSDWGSSDGWFSLKQTKPHETIPVAPRKLRGSVHGRSLMQVFSNTTLLRSIPVPFEDLEEEQQQCLA